MWMVNMYKNNAKMAAKLTGNTDIIISSPTDSSVLTYNQSS